MAAILRALGVGPGDEVATQAFTCLAVPEGIRATGATPVYVDTEEQGVNLCPRDLSAKLSQKTKAVIVQHTFGIPAQLSEIRSVLNERGVPFVEDCCHTLASTYVNQVVGTFGIGAFYSFEWGKPIVAGIGGSAVVHDPALRAKVEEHWESCHGPSWKSLLKVNLQYWAFERMYRPSTYWKVRATFQKLSKAGAAEGNYHDPDEESHEFSQRMAGPLVERLRQKLTSLNHVVENSRRIAGLYDEAIDRTRFRRPAVPEGGLPVYARFPLLAADKERLLARAEEARVEVADWYRTPVHPLERREWGAVGLEPGSCPRAEKLSDEIVSLPLSLKVTDEDVRKTLALFESL
ncbi:MAG: DegT/DnrJ/EryC1/StrS family aminotransferase [Armatimonadetes bacterium]|nr:DegT/DnrJ/EryC1/StrS family aminotransferase [Armatimonadota bacterium]